MNSIAPTETIIEEVTQSAGAAKTAAARAALADRLGDLSPVAAGRVRAGRALEWIYRFGWASPTTIETLVGTERSGLANRLAKNGKVVITKTTSGVTTKFVPGRFLTLTKSGLEDVERLRENLLPYNLDPSRVNQSNLRHDEMAQRVTVQNLVNGSIFGYFSEKELIEKFADGIKHPDVVWVMPTGKRMSIEIELTAKWERDLDVFVRSTLLSLASTEKEPARFDFCCVVSDSPAIIKRYQEAFKPGARYFVWGKGDDKRWARSQERKVPDWAAQKVIWKLLSN